MFIVPWSISFGLSKPNVFIHAGMFTGIVMSNIEPVSGASYPPSRWPIRPFSHRFLRPTSYMSAT